MKKNYSLLTILLTLLSFQISSAQKQANRWYFGMYAGLDFNGGAPVAVTDGALNTVEGCSSIADSLGQLLFYTDGITVYNRQHGIMPNSGDLMGDISSTQSALIVPKPGDPNLYYISTTDADGGPDGFRYNIVDLALDSGRGDVSIKNVLLKNNPTEKISAVGNPTGTGYWVMTHDWGTNDFYAYQITAAGLDTTPVISSVGSVHSNSNFQNCYGQMKFSPNGQKVALGIGYQFKYELFDFDNSTGIVSHPITFNTGSSSRGVEFSANNSKLYTTRYDNVNDIYYLDQFDLSSGNDAAIIASQITLSNAESLAQLQLGPDNKIYVAKFNTPFLGVINHPDLAGAAADYQDNSLSLDTAFSGLILSTLGLPGFVQSYFKAGPTAAFAAGDTAICPGTCISFTDLSLNQATSWRWHFTGATPDTSSQQNPQNICYAAPGLFPVRLIVGNGTSYDTVTVNSYVHVHLPPPVSLSVNGDTLSVFNGTSYQWYLNDSALIGDTSSLFIAAVPGSYTVQVTDDIGCTAISSPIVISGIEKVKASLKITLTPSYIKVMLPEIANGDATLSIMNILGQEMKSAVAEAGQTSMRLDINELPKGFYVAKYSAREKIWSKSFIKE
jgi:PKD repeat protein